MNRPNDIADRSNVFYWQTDRAVEPKEAGKIWADRHRYFNDAELLESVSSVLLNDKLTHIEPLDPAAQTNLGNVNSVRSGVLASGKEVIIRCHPKGIKNGYFYVEAAASSLASSVGMPTYQTFAIHDYNGANDFAFTVIEKLAGYAVQRWIEQHPGDEDKMLYAIGTTMAKMHTIEVNGFGPFDNEQAKNGTLIGLHQTFAAAVRAGLEFNLEVLKDAGTFSASQCASVKQLFSDTNQNLECSRPVLVHNDFADWNLLTDGEGITGILDWDECVGGDPISDIACWSTFFAPERLDGMLKGYWTIADKPANFDEKFELLRLRYTISKMTLRLRRYSWDPSAAIKQKIEFGKLHLSDSLNYFGLN